MVWSQAAPERARRKNKTSRSPSVDIDIGSQNIQTAMTAAAHNQENIAKDVREIQNIINTFLQQAEAAALLYGYDPDDGYEH